MTYSLYLDESKPSINLPFFCLSGCIIKQDEKYTEVIKQINKLKSEIFSDPNTPLHEYEIRAAKDGEYRVFRNKDIREKFWSEYRNILKNFEFHTISSAIHSEKYKKVYSCCIANDEYHVALQIIMENYAYFLAQKNMKGSIYIEKTNDHEAKMLNKHYNRICSTGTLYLHSNELKSRLTGINFLTKSDNNVGLQMADFVPNTLHRKIAGKKAKNPSILDIIENNLYDGQIGLEERFGNRVLLRNNP